MASIKKKSSGGGGANWMDTYGDMVTLLLCFFVLLYSISTVDEQKWMLIVQSFNKDAEISVDDKPLGPEGDGEEELGNDMPMTQDKVNEVLDMIYESLAEYAASQDADSSPTVTKGDGKVFISFNDSIFFAGDSYILLPAGQQALLAILPVLEENKPYIDEIRVMGHTATALPGTYSARKDRTLASDRANEVLVFLLENSALNGARMVSEGFGQWRPVASNNEETERSKNRRVELMISVAELEDPFSGSVEQYYTDTGQERPDDAADGVTG